MTYGIEKTSPGLGQAQEGGGVKPFNGIEASDKKPELTSIHSKRPNTKLEAQVSLYRSPDINKFS
jgi:hypothetical protein